MVDAPRAAAYDVLRAVSERDAYANLELPAALARHGLHGRDAAFVTELVGGTLRMRGLYDAVLDRVSSRGVSAIDPGVLDALRLGSHQLLSTRVPSHAAVSESVDLIRHRVGHKPVGFANAVLRKVGARDREEWIADLVDGLGVADARAVRFSHPRWVVDALTDVVGEDRIEDMLTADNEPPRVTLVARPGLVDPADLPGTPGSLSPYARVLEGGSPGEVPAVRDGLAAVQDEGSQLVAITAADAPVVGRDEQWLDLCAGPGGKAALLGAIAAQRGAHVVANEPQHHRADLVRSSLRALPDVEVTEHDGREGPWAAGSFDRVLVDAPCTGLGALRRRPESRWRRRPSDLDALVPLQRALLERALELTRPGGAVTYATCSPHRAETDEVVRAVAAQTGAEVVSVSRWWPDTDGTDAMFAAVLRP